MYQATWNRTGPVYYLKAGTQAHTELRNVGPRTWPEDTDFMADSLLIYKQNFVSYLI